MNPPLAWLDPGETFPPVDAAWPADSAAPGLLAAGGTLGIETLEAAYTQGIFPWFSEGQPLLWWSPDPRMVLRPAQFRLHRSLRKTLHKVLASDEITVRFDTCFEDVIGACASVPRHGQDGTWIVPDMQAAYAELHRNGHAHSVETWAGGRLVGGLYCVSFGQAVFGESMFARQADASKIALAALVGFCLHHGIGTIDCQQNTRHLASLGAQEIARKTFVAEVGRAVRQPPPAWVFEPVYWQRVLALEAPSLPV